MAGDELACRYMSPDVHELRIKQVEILTHDHSGRFEDLAPLPHLIQEQNRLLTEVKNQVVVVPQHETKIAVIELTLKQLTKWQDDEVKPLLKYVTKLQGERDFIRYIVPILVGLAGALVGAALPILVTMIKQ